ncbi:hypothetical protein ANCCAN_02912 [Ancylostoma caninum]|uniref:Uncharacterized protein n=1 Tax=Ancylostoma caninum TaxID=29170 RepID=A0A368H5I3_ANCCA|nr:hypothetical protein ANCCAN_02912 [Ancylostoma caninum]
MMSAARSAGMRYKKRNSNSSQPKKKGRSGSIASTSQESSPPSLVSVNSSTSLLTVPTQSLMRKRSGSVPAFKVVTLGGMWNLRYEQVRALRMTWARLCEPPRSNCKGIVNLVERVWEKLDNVSFLHCSHECRLTLFRKLRLLSGKLPVVNFREIMLSERTPEKTFTGYAAASWVLTLLHCKKKKLLCLFFFDFFLILMKVSLLYYQSIRKAARSRLGSGAFDTLYVNLTKQKQHR